MSVDARALAMRYVDDGYELGAAAARTGVPLDGLRRALDERGQRPVPLGGTVAGADGDSASDPPGDPASDPPGDPTATGDADDVGEAGEAKKSAATTLVELARDRYVFGVSDGGETYAVPCRGPRVVLMLRGGRTSLRGQLSSAYFARTGRVPSQQALTDALQVIEGIAQSAEPVPLYLRVANHGGALWLDLGDLTGRAVRIGATGWTIEDSVPVLFKRTALNVALPEPARGAGLDDLWALLNVAEVDRPLMAAWLIAALYPDMPHPILGLFGEQGTGKSTACKVCTLILDPGPVPLRKPPRDADSWVTAASGSWVVGLDNVSDIPVWLSDSLCRAVTGDGDVRRRLYTDGDFAVFSFRRVLILNGIDVGAMRGDLAERMLPVDLDLISEDKRREDSDLWAAWRDAHPRVLGALLDLAAGAAGVLPSVHLESKPRMADFARVLAAVDVVLSTDGLSRYRSRSVDLAADGLSADAFVTAMRASMGGVGFEGTAAQLMQLARPADEKWRQPKGWPDSPRRVTSHLRRIAPALRKTGWTVADLGADNHSKVVRWKIVPPLDAVDSP